MQDTGHHVGEDFAGECSVVRGEPMRDRLEHVLGLKPRSAASTIALAYATAAASCALFSLIRTGDPTSGFRSKAHAGHVRFTPFSADLRVRRAASLRHFDGRSARFRTIQVYPKDLEAILEDDPSAAQKWEGFGNLRRRVRADGQTLSKPNSRIEPCRPAREYKSEMPSPLLPHFAFRASKPL
jgi:hypothetical protein